MNRFRYLLILHLAMTIVGFVLAVALGWFLIQHARALSIGEKVLALGREALRVNDSLITYSGDEGKLHEVTEQRNALLRERNRLIKKRNKVVWWMPPVEVLEVPENRWKTE